MLCTKCEALPRKRVLPKGLGYLPKESFQPMTTRFNQHAAPTQLGQLAAPTGPAEAEAPLDVSGPSDTVCR